ncbi:MAG: hypothetical protein AAFZ58_15680 [Pseudomonadota bacterium]
MSESKNDPNDVSLEVAASVAKALTGLKSPSESPKPVLMNDLVEHLRGHRPGSEARINAALAANGDLAALFSMLVRQHRVTHAPRLVAAQSAGAVDERQGEQFVVRLRGSNADPSQVYVILEFDPTGAIQDGQAVNLLAEKAATMATQSFPALHDFRTQVIVDQSSDLCALLRDPDSEISIIGVLA